MSWSDYWDHAREAGLSKAESAGTLILRGWQGSSDLLSTHLKQGLVVELEDPYAVSDTSKPFRQLAVEWKALNVESLLVGSRFSVHLREASHFAGLDAIFDSSRANWSVALPDRKDRAVELQLPFRVGVASAQGFTETHAKLRALVGYFPWLKPLTSIEAKPAGEAGSVDITLFPQGADPVQVLLDARLPIRTGVLIFQTASLKDPELLAKVRQLATLSQTQAIIATTVNPIDTNLFTGILYELSHDNTLDVAVKRAADYCGVPSVDVLLFATGRFLSEGRVSKLADPLRRRIVRRAVPPMDEDRPHTYTYGLESASLEDRLEEALRRPFDAESGTATTIAQILGSLEHEPFANVDRFVQAKMFDAGGSTMEILDPGAPYRLDVRVGPTERGWVESDEPVPEPPLKPEESSLTLTVLFHERHSCPEGTLGAIVLPRAGASDIVSFAFAVHPSAPDFDGRILILHNNRPITETQIQYPVRGKTTDPPSNKTLMRTRAFGATLQLHSPSAGTFRVDRERVYFMRGVSNDTVSIAGYQAQVQSMEKAINAINLEAILPKDLFTNENAAALLIGLARQGYQLYSQLETSGVMSKILADSGMITVIAADAETRVPIDLCYTFADPKSNATICPGAAAAVRQGACPSDCPRAGKATAHVCPMGFLGMQRPIEWRSLDGDQDAAAAAPSPERNTLGATRSILMAHSKNVLDTGSLPALVQGLTKKTPVKAANWDEWETRIAADRPSLLILMPHVDKAQKPPVMEISGDLKDPPSVRDSDVTKDAKTLPMVLLLGCGAATFSIEMQSLPNQFRRNKAAVVIAPVAEILARDAPVLAEAILKEMSTSAPGRPLAEVFLTAKRTLVSSGYLSGMLLLSFGDADWKV